MLQIKRKVPEPLDFVKGLLISADKIPRALSKELEPRKVLAQKHTNIAKFSPDRIQDLGKYQGRVVLVALPAELALQFAWETENQARLNLLIIDELGFVALSRTGAELLFEVFAQRYERGSILVTTNLPFDEWTEVFGSERLTGALLDRLTHHVQILEMNGESYRLKRSRETAASQAPDDREEE